MKRIFIAFILLFSVLFIQQPNVHGTFITDLDPTIDQRLAFCDLCGFCISPTPVPAGKITADPPPSNWAECAKCLYRQCETENVTTIDGAKSLCSLQITDGTNSAPKPISGRYYTSFGCIKVTDEGGAETENIRNNPLAAGTLVSTLLTFIFGITGGVAFIYLVYGSFIILTSTGNPGQINHGKRIVMGAIVGVLFVVLSVFLVQLIGGQVFELPDFRP